MISRFFWLFIFMLYSLPSLAQPFRGLYHGRDSFQGRTAFVSRFQVQSETEPTLGLIEARVQEQIKYTTGPTLNVASFQPGFSYEVLSNTSVDGQIWTVTYRVNARMAVLNDYKDHPLRVPLLLEPQKALRKVTDSTLCLVPSDYEFWYHWQPAEGCPLTENEDYFWVELNFTPENNTAVSYPEYDRLKQKNKVLVHVLFGMNQYSSSQWNPIFSNDPGAYDYKMFRTELLMMGFDIRTWRKKEVREITKEVDGYLPYTEEARIKTQTADIEIRMIYADTGFYHRSLGFHQFLKDAIENAGVIVYAGHSGLGKNLNLNKIEELRGWKFNFPTDRYQIMAQLSCRPYAYYQQDYFSRKKTVNDPNGTRNLDLLGYAGEGLFGDMGPFAANLVRTLIEHFDAKSTLSYQEIYERYAPSFGLPAVNGDEDNPTEL